MLHLTDQTGFRLSFSQYPQRIVSLVPSISETLAHCMAGSELVGVTKFCVHPASLRRTTTMIGGTKNPRLKAIELLAPDLVIANKEENRWEDIEEIRQFCPVYVSDIKNLGDVDRWLQDMDILFPHGTFVDLLDQIRQLSDVQAKSVFRAAYLIWQDPYMTIGGDTFIHAMMEHFGLSNIFGHEKRYPVTDLNVLRTYNPDVVLLSSEPFPFRQRHVAEIQRQLPQIKVLLVDGEVFSWYGTRMLKAMHDIPVLVRLLSDQAGI